GVRSEPDLVGYRRSRRGSAGLEWAVGIRRSRDSAVGAEEAAHAHLHDPGDDREDGPPGGGACEEHGQIRSRHRRRSEPTEFFAGTRAGIVIMVSVFVRVEETTGVGVPAEPWRHTVTASYPDGRITHECELERGNHGHEPTHEKLRLGRRTEYLL